jgi:hypothetical protein
MSKSSAARRTQQPDLLPWVGLEPAPPPPQPFDPQRLTQIAMYIWAALRPVAGTLGEKFFTTRGLAVPGPDVVRFHPSLKFGDTRAAGLVWKLVDQRTGEPCGVLRIFLDSSGKVIARRVLGRGIGASISRAPRPP